MPVRLSPEQCLSSLKSCNFIALAAAKERIDEMTQSCPSRPWSAAHVLSRAWYWALFPAKGTGTGNAYALRLQQQWGNIISQAEAGWLSVTLHPPGYLKSYFKPCSLNDISGCFSYNTSRCSASVLLIGTFQSSVTGGWPLIMIPVLCTNGG